MSDKQYDNTNRGVLFRNNDKQQDTHADYTGSINVEGKEFFLDAWLNESRNKVKYFALRVKPKRASEHRGGARNPPPREPAPAGKPDFDDDIPF